MTVEIILILIHNITFAWSNIALNINVSHFDNWLFFMVSLQKWLAHFMLQKRWRNEGFKGSSNMLLYKLRVTWITHVFHLSIITSLKIQWKLSGLPKILESLMKFWMSPKKIWCLQWISWGLQWKFWGSTTKIWGLDAKLGVSNENLESATKIWCPMISLGSPTKIWGSPKKICGSQR